MVMKSSNLWSIKPCSPLKIKRTFGGRYHLHLHGRKISQARKREARSKNIPLKRRLD
jgi:hypothetical protein